MTSSTPDTSPTASPVAVIGAGPAGLMAAAAVQAAGHHVRVFDAMPTAGRKFLLAGIGGLNLTHSEAFAPFLSRYRDAADWLQPMLQQFDNEAVRNWAAGLGVETFVGTSGRVFPREMKAAPLLRAWLHQLRENGVQFFMRHRWQGWRVGDAPTTLRFATSDGPRVAQVQAVILALGGGSYARLGSDGAWLDVLQAQGVPCQPLRPANCGFELSRPWSDFFRERFCGQPLKNVALHFRDPNGITQHQLGECMITATGIEGGLIYAHSAALRDGIARDGAVQISLDLAPGRSLERLQQDLARPRGKRSFANHLHNHAGLEGAKAALLREAVDDQGSAPDPTRLSAAALAQRIKAFPLQLARPRPLDEAISSAGGVARNAVNADLMLTQLPGVFCCGEMLDWDAPTGGYLLTACLATGRAAGIGAARWLAQRHHAAAD